MANGGIIGTVNNPTSTTATGVWQQEEQYEAKVTDTWPQRTLFTTKSLRFNDDSSDSLTKSLGTPTSTKIGTFSCWVKLGNVTTEQTMLGAYADSSNRHHIEFQADHNIEIFGKASNSTNMELITNAFFRDVSAWYNIVVAYDTSQGTASNRVKLYVNGVQETSFATETYPAQDTVLQFNTSGSTIAVGRNQGGNYADGYLAETILIDGQQLAPTSFGVTNSDGVWTPISYTGTFGNNGFNLQFENAAALGTDSSPNGNNFTVNNLTSIDQSTDYPVVNFATMSTPTWFDGTKANGGLTISTNQTSYRYQPSSIGVSSGKWYWEIKLTTLSDYALMGITDAASPIQVGTNWILGSGAYDYSVVYNTAGGNGHKYNNAGTSPTNTPGAFMGGFAQGNIVMFALDCDNNTLKIGVNDSWSNGSGSTNQTFSNTTAISITAPASTNTGVYFPAVGDYGGATSVFDLNFGSPAYSISSSNADGNGYGNFEYAVPSGYYALNTANLAEFG